jgi:hypothetical protein
MTARQKRTVLAKRVITSVKSVLVELKDLEDDIRQLWVEFENLPTSEKILGCSTRKQFCERRLGKTPRAVRYMLDGGNHKRGETVSPMKNDPPSLFDIGPDEQFFAKTMDEAKKRVTAHIEPGPSRFETSVKHFAKLMIKEGYRALASKHHPDKGGNTEDMAGINAAEHRLSTMVEDW